MGVASDIDNTVDSFKSNPKALEQRYAKNKQLSDLLALQKIKSILDNTSREMALKLDNNPKTVAEQRQAEVLAGVSGVLQQQRAAKNANLQKVASRGIPTAPAPNMTKMADGGIVGFATGKSVPTTLEELIEKQKADLKKQYDDGDIDYSEYSAAIEKLDAPRVEGPPGELIKSNPILTADQEYDDKTFSFGFGKSAGDKVPTAGNPLNEFQKNTEIGKLAQRQLAAGTYPRKDPVKAGGLAGIGVDEAMGDTTIPPRLSYDGEGGVAEGLPIETGVTSALDKKIVPNFGNKDDKSGGITNTNFTPSNVTYKPGTEERKAITKETKDLLTPIANIDADEKGKTTRKEAQDYYGYSDAEMEIFNKMMADKKTLYDKIMDPEKLRQQSLSAALRGAGNQVGFGNLGGGISSAIANERAAQEKSAIGKLLDREKDAKSLINKSRDIRQTAFASGELSKTEANKLKMAGIKELAGLNVQRLKDVSTDATNMLAADTANMNKNQKAAIETAKLSVMKADIEVKAQVANLNAEIAKEKNAIQREFNKITAAGNKLKGARAAYTATEKIISDLQAKFTKIYAEQISKASLLGGEEAKAKIAALRKERDAQIKLAIASAKQMRERFIAEMPGGSTDLTTK